MKPAGIPLFFIAVIISLVIGFRVEAKSWKGATPGLTTKQQVTEKFGKPTQTFSKGGKLSDGVNYQGDQAIKGSREANFYFNKHGILFRIDVFPSREITKKEIVRIFGKSYVERVTRSGHTFFNYLSAGMTVFFDKERDLATSFMFTETKPGDKP